MIDLAIDVLTPKQALFFERLIRRLKEQGRSVLVFTRRYREVDGVLALRKIQAVSVGKHGGEDLYSKLWVSAHRTLQLTKLVNENRPRITMSFSSPEMARVSYGLKIPHLCVSDSPHAEAASRLAVPFSHSLYTPWIIAKAEWNRYGISSERIEQYHALDPWAWLRVHKPDPGILDQLRLDRSKPLLVVRPEEIYAAYISRSRIEEATSLVPIINKLCERHHNLQIIAIGRYREQILTLRKTLSKRVIVPQRVIDTTSLLSYADLFIGAGGTMTAEAALLGTPTISCYPNAPTIIERYLVEQGLVLREISPQKVTILAGKILRDVQAFKKRQVEKAKQLSAQMEDPVEFMQNRVLKFLGSRKLSTSLKTTPEVPF